MAISQTPSRPTPPPTTAQYGWFVVVSIVSTMLVGCDRAEPPTPVAPTPMLGLSTIAFEVRGGNLSRAQSLIGHVRPARATPIVSEAAGRIVVAHAEDGALTKAGALLFKLDDSRQRLALEQAEAQIAVLDVDEKWLDAELVRKTVLADKGSITTYAKDAARYQRDKVRAAKAQAEVGKKNAQRALADTRVLAPHAGELTGVAAKRGELVAAGRPLAVLVDRSTVRIRVGVSAADAAQRTLGETARLLFPGVGHDKLTGTVRFIAPLASADSGLFDVDVELAAPPPAVRAGMSAQVLFGDDATWPKSTATLIPRAAVLTDNESAYVFVIDNDRVQRRDIQTGASTTKWVEVAVGLDAGEWIAVSGLYALADNDAVVVSERRSAPKDSIGAEAAP